MRLLRALIILCYLLPVTGSHAENHLEERHAVLVVAKKSDIAPLTQRELRKLYLGFTVKQDNQRVQPLRNQSDLSLSELFLQKALFMSSQNYERQLVSRIFRLGGQRPAIYSTTEDLIDALQSKPGAITYMWATTAKRTPGVKVLQELW